MSLKKISEMTGVSIATVSRVLNNPEHNCNNKELKEKIWKAASEIKYTPNFSAKALRMGEKKEAVFTVDIFLTRFNSLENDAFFMEIYQILKEELLANGCILGQLLGSMDILSSDSAPTKRVPYKTEKKLMAEANVTSAAFVNQKKDTGLIILGKCPDNILPAIKKKYSYIIGIDRNPTDYLYDEITCDGAAATKKAIEYLFELGHRSIAYIGDCNDESRYVGYYQTLLANKMPLNYSFVFPTRQTENEGFETMLKILDSDKKPSAIFCANDTTAIGVLAALKKKRHKGYNPSVISIDDIEAASHTKPMLTTISIPKREMAHLAVTTLLDRKAGKHVRNLRIELPCDLIKRESCDRYEF